VKIIPVFNQVPLIEGMQIITLTSAHVISPNSTRSWRDRCNPQQLTSSTLSKLRWSKAGDYRNIVLKNSSKDLHIFRTCDL